MNTLDLLKGIGEDGKYSVDILKIKVHRVYTAEDNNDSSSPWKLIRTEIEVGSHEDDGIIVFNETELRSFECGIFSRLWNFGWMPIDSSSAEFQNTLTRTQIFKRRAEVVSPDVPVWMWLVSGSVGDRDASKMEQIILKGKFPHVRNDAPSRVAYRILSRSFMDSFLAVQVALHDTNDHLINFEQWIPYEDILVIDNIDNENY